ncbi:MAG: hypothetical protein PHE83_05820 [Opitutaceae bacterium]|nr:hypothetical protein [Opitutaceae bacterium]
MRTHRQHRLDRVIARELFNCGSYLVPESTLIDAIMVLGLVPRPTQAEIEESIRHHETEGRLTGVTSDTGTKWKLSDAGRAWWHENQ